MHAVNKVDGHEIFAAYATGRPGSMEGKNGDDDVDPTGIQLSRTKGAQIHRGVCPHAKTVGADEPGISLLTRRP